MRRVMIIGSPGSGKTTLALELGRRTGLPVVHVDPMFYDRGWALRGAEETRALMLAAVAQPSWIIEGNHSSTFGARAERADHVVFLDVPTRTCLARVVRRTWRDRGRVRPSLPEGCVERFDAGFLHFVATYRWRGRRKALELLEATRGALSQVVLRSATEVESWLARLE